MVRSFVLFLLSLATLHAGEVDVYLLGGQSNMQGIGKISELDEEGKKPVGDTFYWMGKTGFEKLDFGNTKTSSRPGEFGPEIGLARGLRSTPERPAYLVKYHASGKPLHHGFNGGKWLDGEPAKGRVNFYPGAKPGDENRGTLYVAMMHRFRAALKALRDEGHTPVVHGFFWMQGEADAKAEISANEYAASLKRLRDRLAEDLELEKLPLVFGQVLPHEPAKERFTHRKEIREAMAAADERSGKPGAIKDCRMVSTDKFSLKDDTVHYDAKGQLQLGLAFAEALRAMSGSK